MIGAAEWEWADDPEWRQSVVGTGWWTLYDPDQPDRTIYAGPCKADRDQLAEWVARRRRGEQT